VINIIESGVGDGSQDVRAFWLENSEIFGKQTGSRQIAGGGKQRSCPRPRD